MLRTLGYIFFLSVLAVVAAWLADSPGVVSLEWRGWRIDTSFALLAAAVAIVSGVVAILYRFWLFLRRVPGRVVGSRRDIRQRRGYLALTRGMVAVAAGDSAEARKQARRADGLLDDPPLTMLLSAQASQMAGDEGAAGKFFGAMLAKPETEFLGVRGLLTQALKKGNRKSALELAERAYRLRPKSDWVAKNLLDLQVRDGAWADARTTLDQSIKNKLVPAKEAAHRLVVLDYRLSLEAAAAGDSAKKTKLLKAANDRDPGFVPAAVLLAEENLKSGRRGRAAAIVEKAWSINPHPDLTDPYWRARGADSALDRVKAAERLARANPDHPESHMVVAEISLEAKLWGESRHHLGIAGGDSPPARVCRLMAELEESERNDTDGARNWLMRASLADPDPAWVCGDCGNSLSEWEIVCGNCDAFASFSWRTPPHVVRLLESATETAAPAAIAAAGNDGDTSGELPAELPDNTDAKPPTAS
jgi:HemY protein